MSLVDKTINGLRWTAIHQFGLAIIGFVVQIILAWYITPTELGIYGILLVFNSVGNSLSDSGMGQSLIRSDTVNEDDYSTVFVSNLLLSICLYIVIVLIAPFVANYYNHNELDNFLYIYSFSIILTSFSVIHISRLTREMNFKKQATIQVLSILFSSFIGVGAAYLNYGVWALVIMAVSKNFILSLQYWFFSGWRPTFVFNKVKFKEHFDFGYKITLSGLIGTIITNLVSLILAKYYLPIQLGFYTKAAELQGFAKNSITSVLNKVTFPLFALIKSDKSRLLKGYKKIQNIVLFVMCPFMLSLILVSYPLIISLYGQKWEQSVFFFNIFAITGIFYPIHIYNLNVLKVSGKSNVYLIAAVLKKINLLIIILATCWISISAFMYGLAFHSFISLFINMYFGSKELGYKVSEQFKDFLVILLPAFSVFGLFYMTERIFKVVELIHPISYIIIIPLLYALVYFTLHFYLKTKPYKDFMYMVDRFREKL